jgi:hypothetical protein
MARSYSGMAITTTRIKAVIKISSRDPNTPTPVLFGNVLKELPDLQAKLRSRGASGLSARRRQGMTLDPSIVFFTVAVIVGKRITETLVEKIVADVYGWLKRKGKTEVVETSIEIIAANPRVATKTKKPKTESSRHEERR